MRSLYTKVSQECENAIISLNLIWKNQSKYFYNYYKSKEMHFLVDTKVMLDFWELGRGVWRDCSKILYVKSHQATINFKGLEKS